MTGQVDNLAFLLSVLSESNSSIVLAEPGPKDSPIIYVNPAFEKMTGYANAEIIGRDCRFLQGDDRDQPDRTSIKAAMRDGRACECLFRNYRKNGEMFWNKLYMFPLRIVGNTVSHFAGVQHDVTVERSLLLQSQQTATERRILIEELESKGRHLARLSLDLVTAQELERKALALDLNDEIGQRLSALNLLLHRARPLFSGGDAPVLWSRIEGDFSALVHLVRNMSVSLRPPGLDYLGLESTIRQLLTRQFEGGPDWVFEYAGLPGRLVATLEISVFRIVQECVNNIVRHAQATHVVVEVNGGADGSELELIVRDDGIGFDADAWRRDSARFPLAGLSAMCERVQLLGGTLCVDACPGSGTRITVTLPLRLQ